MIGHQFLSVENGKSLFSQLLSFSLARISVSQRCIGDYFKYCNKLYSHVETIYSIQDALYRVYKKNLNKPEIALHFAKRLIEIDCLGACTLGAYNIWNKQKN